MKVLFIATIGLLILIAGLQLGMRAGYRIAEEQAEQQYIEQYLLDHEQGG